MHFLRIINRFFSTLTSKKAIFIIVIGGIIVFGNMLFNNFVWDDIKYIQQNTEIHTLNFSTILGQSLVNATGQYRPIPALYASISYLLFKETPFFYHLVQLFLHTANTLLLFFLFKKFFNNTLSLFLSLLFLISPIQVESVSYMAGAGEPLFFLFGIVSLLLSFKKEISKIRGLTIFCLLLSSFLTKETGFLFLFIILLFRILFRKKSINIFLFGGFFTTIIYFFIRFVIGNIYFKIFEIIPIHKLTFLERLYNIPAIFFYYIKTFFFPANLAISQNWIVKTVNLSNFYFPLSMDLLFFVLLGILGRYLYTKNRENFKIYLFFLFWFGVGLLFHSQIFPLDMTVADRWFYFPLAGLLGCIGLLIKAVNFRRQLLKITGITAAGIILIMLSWRTIVRNTNWIDQRTLLIHDISVSDDYTLEDLLAIDYLGSKQYDQAIKHMVKSIGLNPDPTNINNLGVIYQLSGNHQKAKAAYYSALNAKQNSNKIFAYINLANFLVYYDDPKLAVPMIKDNLLKIDPGNSRYWLLLAIAEYKLHNQEGALQAIQEAYALSPADPSVNNIYNAIINQESAGSIMPVNETFSN